MIEDMLQMNMYRLICSTMTA